MCANQTGVTDAREERRRREASAEARQVHLIAWRAIAQCACLDLLARQHSGDPHVGLVARRQREFLEFEVQCGERGRGKGAGAEQPHTKARVVSTPSPIAPPAFQSALRTAALFLATPLGDLRMGGPLFFSIAHALCHHVPAASSPSPLPSKG
eukprot:scaffold110416_cov29-Tisochrysis_lutea.AAC.3